ncbi:TetR/AcrR family transcriptional regulator [Endozoicomonas numazuensis]|uniref:HTH tetR-type domain-containing protein n=1 Tax=Endozoicomonas numazuensis TaxID=1137799 RepID=A0A081NED6_9GAMM|nr:TetR/AcrR family transcriptional regulator [Endozoicomonas numazuensis]KEQ16809.1 hypothetical protein GZ78_19240 [Endozoicomonas numazuensis]
MARRYDHSREEIQQLTLEKVSEILKTESVHSLSLRKIAKVVGYTPATLINIFGNYSGLLLAVNAESLDELHELSITALASEANALKKLHALANVYLSYACEHTHRWQLIFDHRMPEGEEVPHWHQQRIDLMFSLLDGCLQIIAPEKSSSERETATRVLWAGVHGICLLATEDKLFSKAHASGEMLIQSLIDNYLNSWC